ncbi:MAG: hypothetical protein ACRCS3_03765, partial [Paracoccaceae bacterium]
MYFNENLKRIKSLLSESGDPTALTYAALECRICLEFYAYSRLKQALKNVSTKDIRVWQPSKVLKKLAEKFGNEFNQGFTLSMGREPIEKDKEVTEDDFADVEWVEIGRQPKINVKELESIWQSLSQSLHVMVPQNSDAELTMMDTTENLLPKVNRAISFIENLNESTLNSIFLCDAVSFRCM